MLKALLIAATFVAAATAADAQVLQASHATSGQVVGDTRTAAEDFVRRFFAAYDAHDVVAARALLAPDMKIVAIDARERNVAALLQDIAAASASPPPRRELGNFEVIDAGTLIVVAFDNRVTSSAGEASRSFRYRESWVLQPMPDGLRAIWSTCSIDGAEPDPHYVQVNADAAAQTGISAQDQPAVDFIAHFFDAYIGRRPEEMKALFLPGSKFVFPNAEETSIDAMAEQQAAHPEPPRQYARPKNGGHFLDHFEILHAGSAMVVAFDNHVTDWRSGHPEREEHAFRESWIIKETPDGLRDVWVAMSLYGNGPPHEAAPATSRD